MLDATIVERKVSPSFRRLVHLSGRLQWNRRWLSDSRRTHSRCSKNDRVNWQTQGASCSRFENAQQIGKRLSGCKRPNTRHVDFAAAQIRQVIMWPSRHTYDSIGSFKLTFSVEEPDLTFGFEIAVALRKEHDVSSSVLAAIRIAVRVVVVSWQPR